MLVYIMYTKEALTSNEETFIHTGGIVKACIRKSILSAVLKHYSRTVKELTYAETL